MADKFWDDMLSYTASSSPMDEFLAGNERSKIAYVAPKAEFTSGQRVRFIATLQSILSYPKVPEKNLGTVIRVKSASVLKDHVFVRFDDGFVMPLLSKHLAAVNTDKVANFSFMVSSLRDVSPQYSTTSSEDLLVNKSSRELWSCAPNEGGGFIVERLFDEGGKPLKEV